MPHDPELVAETRARLVKSQQDMRMARLALDAKPPLFGQSTYHAQQAAEKAIKGFLTWHRRIFDKVHDLGKLGRQCAAIDAELEPPLRRASRLSDYAWKYRYPGEPAEPTLEETVTAIQLAEAVANAVLDRLPEEARPDT